MKNASCLLAPVSFALAVVMGCGSTGGSSRDTIGGSGETTAGGDVTTDLPDVGGPDVGPSVDASETPDIVAVPDIEAPDLSQPDVPDLSEPDTGPPLPADGDGDGVPDAADLFPTDPGLPGKVTPGKVYAQTADTLYLMDVKTYKIVPIGAFTFDDGQTYKITDIAIDRYGVLYGVAYDAMFTCEPSTAACTSIGTLPEEFNALSWVPAGLIDAGNDVMVGAAGSNWYRLDRNGTQYVATLLGSYGGDYSSSGDIFSIAGVGTYATVNRLGQTDDFVVEVDPKTGAVVREVGQMFGYGKLFGVAGWTDRVFAFDSTGAILIVDINDGTILKELASTEYSWWGAGVPTVIPAAP